MADAHPEEATMQKGEHAVETLCREHGPNITIDEDGCCLACGAIAYPADEQVKALLEDLGAMNKVITMVAENAAMAKDRGN